MSFEKIFYESEFVLTEGAIVERLKAEMNIKMDKAVNHAGLIYSRPAALELLYRQYLEIGKTHDLPMMIMTPTRRVNVESVKKSGYPEKDMIRDSCALLKRIKESYGKYARKILVGGLLGCRGDAYSGEKVMDAPESYAFHKIQAAQFREEIPDFLFAGIMPEINEALGMAEALAETQLPYIISFMLRKNGCLLNGTPLCDAIAAIDAAVSPKPVCYMANCIHPANLVEALKNEKNRRSPHLERFKGIQANASCLDPEELNNCSGIFRDDFDAMIDDMLFLKTHFGFKILGGCCGTNDLFIDKLAQTIQGT